MLLVGGSAAGFIGFVFEFLPGLSGSPSGDSGYSATGAGLLFLFLGVLHLGLAVFQFVAALQLWRCRARSFVLICCGLTVLLGVGMVNFTTSNVWSNLTVLGGLIAACVAWAMPSSRDAELVPSPVPTRNPVRRAGSYT
jgi:hypothetical protein